MSSSHTIYNKKIYTSIVLYSPLGEIIWQYQQYNSGEYIAGCIVALHNLLNNDNYILAIDEHITIRPTTTDIWDVLKQFITFRSIDKSTIRYYPISRPFFGWWIKSRSYHLYDLYKFLSVDFTEGFINTCKNFDMDFRTYIYAPPFQDGQYYDIIGYDISVPSDHFAPTTT